MVVAALPQTGDQPQPFRCDVEPHRDMVRVVPVGELDVATASEVAERLRELVDAGFIHVQLDLRRVTFLCSAGIHTILTADRASRLAGGDLALVAGPPDVQRVLEICGLLDRLTFHAP